MGNWTLTETGIRTGVRKTFSAPNLFWVSQKSVLNIQSGGKSGKFTNWFNKEIGWTEIRSVQYFKDNVILFKSNSGFTNIGTITNRTNLQPRFIIKKDDTEARKNWLDGFGGIVIPEPVKEIFNICANVFRLQGSTAIGADPQVEVLVSSGCTWSQQQLDGLEATGHIIKLVDSDDILTVGVEPIDTPESTFTRDKDGNKIFNIKLVEKLVIRDDFS